MSESLGEREMVWEHEPQAFTNKWIIKFLRRLTAGHLPFFELKKLKIFEGK